MSVYVQQHLILQKRQQKDDPTSLFSLLLSVTCYLLFFYIRGMLGRLSSDLAGELNKKTR